MEHLPDVFVEGLLEGLPQLFCKVSRLGGEEIWDSPVAVGDAAAALSLLKSHLILQRYH
jgi:hypothetical protein